MAGEPLVARDAYGSRFLVTVPFGYGQAQGGSREQPDHWYAWDIDWCWTDMVVGAGVTGSAAEALREWQDAVGTLGLRRDAVAEPARDGRPAA